MIKIYQIDRNQCKCDCCKDKRKFTTFAYKYAITTDDNKTLTLCKDCMSEIIKSFNNMIYGFVKEISMGEYDD